MKRFDDVQPPAAANGGKLAQSVARRIVADVAAAGWPVGEVLGSEPELLQRYGVSRAVFREAVRLVEHQQVARTRRGPGGGLVVTAPTLESVVDPVAVYLFYANARVSDVAEARLALEETVAELAPSRLTEHDIDHLRQLSQRELAGEVTGMRELHDLLATITRNPALEVFVHLLGRLAQLSFPDIRKVRKALLDDAAHAHGAIVAAVVSGDEGRARHRMRTHLEAEAAYLRERVSADQPLDPSVLRSLSAADKRGERVARAIFVEIVEAGWHVGRLIGSEADLMERFDVSRAALREAVRLLEHHRIAIARRGPGGGLFVARPEVDSAAAALAVLLEHRGIRPRDLFEVRTAIELTIVELVVKGLDGATVAELTAALVRDQQAATGELPTSGHHLHGVLAAIAGNPVFELLSAVVVRLTAWHQEPRARADLPPADVYRAHATIVQSIIDRDLELARHRMRRHLEHLALFMP